MENTIAIELSKESAFDVAILVQYALNHSTQLSEFRASGVEFIAQTTKLRCNFHESISYLGGREIAKMPR